MTKARSTQVCLEATNFYHCYCRVVRSGWLIGNDPKTNKNYDHRRQWIEDRIMFLADIFAIDIAAYAVMSNHYHIVLAIDKAQAENWDVLEVITRWHRLYKGTLLTNKFIKGEPLSEVELDAVAIKAEIWRKRLFEIGWLMRNINEPIARQANSEDGCKGRFWESRYKSQALLDEKAVLSCMAYVDLNPIRAKMHRQLETSAHTSIKKRCKKASEVSDPNALTNQAKGLMNFAGRPKKDMPKGIPCRLIAYLELVEWTGRQIKA
ncbi:transposase [Marinicellulosiphila megalodicopiae]|uniref:transposase n=1 Tax=Marinicellulosiphila megalodicopiae TaxID=2724896 RepID=UPI003BAE28D7